MKLVVISDTHEQYEVCDDLAEVIKHQKPEAIVELIKAAINTAKEATYNPDFGDDKLCRCSHTYYRHFDTYEEMSPVGCKYCPCRKFDEVKTGFDKYVAGKMQDPDFAKGYQEAMEEITKPSWSNTLNYKFKFWGEVSVFFDKMVVPSGYPFFLWNDRIYKRTSESTWEDTNLTIKDLK